VIPKKLVAMTISARSQSRFCIVEMQNVSVRKSVWAIENIMEL